MDQRLLDQVYGLTPFTKSSKLRNYVGEKIVIKQFIYMYLSL